MDKVQVTYGFLGDVLGDVDVNHRVSFANDPLDVFHFGCGLQSVSENCEPVGINDQSTYQPAVVSFQSICNGIRNTDDLGTKRMRKYRS